MGIIRKISHLIHPVVAEVWMLHRVVEVRSDKAEQRVLEVTPRWLEQTIVERRRMGYSFVGIDKLHAPGRNICITFDDGYQDNYSIAYPLLKRLDVPFAVYVSTDFLNGQKEMWWYPGQKIGISGKDLRVMAADPLCIVGAHTVSHPHLGQLSKEQQRSEILQSKLQLETLLGHEIRHFSYPHGDYTDTTVDICREAGFITAATASGCRVRTNTDPLRLDRIALKQPD